MTIAVTGPFASGKSTFVRLLGELGAETVSADGVVHDLLSGDDETIARIVERFGAEVRGVRGIDRRALGREVFGDAEALKDLEGILHPRVRREVSRRAASSNAGVFVAEIPLLFEVGQEDAYDLAVAVVTPVERRKEWSGERGVEEPQRRAIEARQLTGEEKARRADVVVQNDGNLDRLREQAGDLWASVLRERSTGGNLREQEET